jgi:effector-binding domain-containing protein
MSFRPSGGREGMTNEPQISERPAFPYIGMRRRVTDGIAAAVDGAFPELFRRLGQAGVQPAGPPFIRFVSVDDEDEPTELELAVPVAAEAATDTLPAGRYATLVHVGPYRHATEPDLAVARATLQDWAERRGLTLSGYLEHYRIGPVEDPDYTKWETELAFLLG